MYKPKIREIWYKFDVDPVAKPRMTRSDTWKKRPIVLKYRAFKDEMKWRSKENGFVLGETLHVTFCVPMPPSWSKRKRDLYEGSPHKQRPDLDNYLKALMDFSDADDSHVYEINAMKIWADKGAILIH